MCIMCEVQGNGQIHYLNPENFKQSLMNEATRGMMVEWRDNWELHRNDLSAFESASWAHRHQIATMEEALKVVDIAKEVCGGRFATIVCPCKYILTGGVVKERVCVNWMSPSPPDIPPPTYPLYKEYKVATTDEVKEIVKYADRRGLVHNVGSWGHVGGPFSVSNICHCEYPTCHSVINRLDHGLAGDTLLGHYVAMVTEPARCTGVKCDNCVKYCMFGAVRVSVMTEKPRINPTKCHGCGLCGTHCPQKIIEMVPRAQVPTAPSNYELV